MPPLKIKVEVSLKTNIFDLLFFLIARIKKEDILKLVEEKINKKIEEKIK